jgi:hypothetical protein
VYYNLLLSETFLKDYLPLINIDETSTGEMLDATMFNNLMKSKIAADIDVDDEIREIVSFSFFSTRNPAQFF